MPLRSFGQVAYTFVGNAYTQNFSTLPATATSWGDLKPTFNGTMYAGASGITNEGTFSLPSNGTAYDLSGITTGTGLANTSINGGSAMQGWYANDIGGSGTLDLYGSDSGSFTTGGVYSYGASNSGVRSLGGISTSTSGTIEFGMLLYNNTANAYNQFSLSYVSELWHNNTIPKNLNFGYTISSSDFSLPTSSAAGFTSVASLGSGSFNDNATTVSEQNAPIGTLSVSGNRIALSSAWAPNDYLWLTFTTNSDTGSAQSVGIGSLNFNADIASTDTWSDSIHNNAWDIQTSTNWTISSNAGSYSDGDNVIFGGAGMTAGVGTVVITAAGVNPGGTAVSNSTGTYKFLNAASATLGLGGNGALTMSGAGTLDLSGLTVSNTYSGGTNLNAGTVVVSSDNQLGAQGGGLVFNGGALALNVALTSGGTVTTSRSIVVQSGGGTISSGIGGGLIVNTAPSIGGNLSIAGSGSVDFAAGVSGAIGGAVTVGANSALFLGTSAYQTVDFSGGALTLNGSLVLTTPSRYDFNGANTFGGPGTIYVLGSASAADSGVAASGTLAASTVTITNVSANGGGTISSSIVLNPANSGSLSGNVASPYGSFSTGTFSFGNFTAMIGATTGGQTLAVTGNISGNADLIIAQGKNSGGGGGQLFLLGSNSYQGATLFNSGGVVTLGANSLPNTPNDNVIFGSLAGAGPGTLDLNGNSQTVASISTDSKAGSTAYTITSSSGAATLTLDGSASPATNFKGTLTGNLSLVQSGTNAIGLSGSSTYTGATVINSGTLAVTANGSINNTTGVAVNGGYFGGNGHVANPVVAGVGGAAGTGGTLFEGGTTSAGSLTVNNSVTLNSDATLQIKIKQPASAGSGAGTGVEGSDNDTLVVTGGGAFTPGGATLDVIPLVSSFSLGTSGFSYTYTIVDATQGSLASGTFAGLAQGQVYTQGSLSYSVDYGQAQPGDIELIVTAVPEPTSLGFLAVGSAALLRRRRAIKA